MQIIVASKRKAAVPESTRTVWKLKYVQEDGTVVPCPGRDHHSYPTRDSAMTDQLRFIAHANKLEEISIFAVPVRVVDLPGRPELPGAAQIEITEEELRSLQRIVNDARNENMWEICQRRDELAELVEMLSGFDLTEFDPE